jgi:hypothetical protein
MQRGFARLTPIVLVRPSCDIVRMLAAPAASGVDSS